MTFSLTCRRDCSWCQPAWISHRSRRYLLLPNCCRTPGCWERRRCSLSRRLTGPSGVHRRAAWESSSGLLWWLKQREIESWDAGMRQMCDWLWRRKGSLPISSLFFAWRERFLRKPVRERSSASLLVLKTSMMVGSILCWSNAMWLKMDAH